MNRIRNIFKTVAVAVGTSINVFCIGHCAVEYGAEVTFVSISDEPRG